MFKNSSDNTWEHYGSKDPYYGVCTNDKFMSPNLNPSAREEFFESGVTHINNVMGTIKKYIDPAFSPKSALDFGCGVGRLLIPFSHIAENITGVDVSESYLKECKRNCEANSITNFTLCQSDDSLSAISGKYDLIHSHIVFQHIPVQRGEAIFSKLIEHLSEGGVGALHFNYHRNVSPQMRIGHWIRKYIPLANRIVNLISKKPHNSPLMQMNRYNLNKLFFIMQKMGIQNTYTQTTDSSGQLGIILYFQK
jgi:2-polyprenyl-3-methyl-5-hydroxy-6-metoxy-1,4-benzoquinol methylase